MPRFVIAALALVAFTHPVSADPAPIATFDAKVVAIEPGPHVQCGDLMATQPVKLDIVKVSAGKLQPKTSVTVRVLTCFGGPLLRPIAKEPGIYELDPAKLRAGSDVHLEAEDLGRGAWFTTVDKIRVVKY